MITLRLTAALALVVGTLGLMAALLMPNPAAQAAPALHAAAHTAHAGGTAVSSTLDGTEQDAAFLADLFEGATDYTPQQAADLIAVAHRVCDLQQPRADWMAALTTGTHALTDGEAGKLLDTAQAAYCPEALRP